MARARYAILGDLDNDQFWFESGFDPFLAALLAQEKQNGLVSAQWLRGAIKAALIARRTARSGYRAWGVVVGEPSNGHFLNQLLG